MKKEHLQEWVPFSCKELKRLIKFRLEAKLDSTKSTLLLANQIYYQAVQTQKWESLQQDIYQLQSLQRHHHEEIKTQAIAIQSTQDTGCHCVAIQTLRHQRPRRTRQYKTITQLSGAKYMAGMLGVVTWKHESSAMAAISLNLPLWIYARKFDINLKRSYQGWDASFRTYRRVPYEARVFGYCVHGDVKGLQQLFQSGAASPFEVDPDGKTPLHVGHNESTSKFGADCCSVCRALRSSRCLLVPSRSGCWSKHSYLLARRIQQPDQLRPADPEQNRPETWDSSKECFPWFCHVLVSWMILHFCIQLII
jgi:hypothetical protein